MNTILPKAIILRTDANSRIGSGHLMRCLALSQAFAEKQIKPIFVLSSFSQAVPENKTLQGFDFLFVSGEPGESMDSIQTAELAVQNNASWIVTDGYHFGELYHQNLKEFGHRTLYIDDCGHLPFYHSDIVLNQNIHADEGQYKKRSPQTKLLLGSRYFLLRNEFLDQGNRRRTIPEQAKKILITMGGSDPHNTTLSVLKWLSALALPNIFVDVVLGPSNQYFQEIRMLLHQVPFVFRIHRSANNMANLMTQADLAISSAGTTSWELAFMGVPSLLIAIAENQLPIAEKLHAMGASVYLGRHGEITSGIAQQEISRLICSPDLRKKMMRVGKGIIDGMGRERVVEVMEKNQIALRPANEGDCRVIYDWSNDSAVREASFSKEAISWDTHVQWFRNKLKDAKCEMYIAQNEDGKQLGQVRFEMDHSDAIISVSLDPSCRNKGYGREIIAIGTRKILERRNIKQVRAMVKKDNIASIRAFEKASFEKNGMEDFSGELSFCLIYRNQDRENHVHNH